MTTDVIVIMEVTFGRYLGIISVFSIWAIVILAYLLMVVDLATTSVATVVCYCIMVLI